jgi:hypothetical protein
MRVSTTRPGSAVNRGKAVVVGVLAVALAALTSASMAFATPHHPKGEFATFGDCPLSIETLNACVYSESSGGSFTIGKKTVPLKNPVILQGGFKFTGPAPLPQAFFGAEDGDTLSKTPQPVPGGLLGVEAPTWWPKFLQDAFNEMINNGLSGVTATVELAAPATSIGLNIFSLLSGNGTALSLPVKIKLSNTFLGSNCYIGSSSSPVNLAFTTGTTSPPPPNTPITGSPGTLTSNETGTLLTISGGRLVNNSYSAPGANGCGGLFSFLIDPFVNSIIGVPSAAGNNTAILEGKLLSAEAAAVRASE